MHLRGLTQLKQLDLRATEVDDAGLMHIREMAQLQSLDLTLTAVSDAGLQRLQTALPTLFLVQEQ